MQGGYIRQERPYVTFAALLVTQKREKKKSFFMFLRGRTMFDPTMRVVDGADPYKLKLKHSQKKKQKICTPSRQRIYSIHARPSFFSGRADNACTNLLGFFVRYVRTRGMSEVTESKKTANILSARTARTRHAWLARLTRARRGGSEGGRRESSLLTFGTFRQ